MSLAISHDQQYTYGDYCRWPDDERGEIIPTTALVDLNLKRNLYQKHGVKEY